MRHMRAHNTTHNKNKMPDIKNFYTGDENLVLHIFIRPHASQHTKKNKKSHINTGITTKAKTPAHKQNYTQPSHQHKSKPFPATNTTKIRTNLIHFVYIKHPNKKNSHSKHNILRATIPHTPTPQHTKLYIIYIMRLL